ncbi:hypothetical protein CKA38_08590 [Ereboglobus luteus]|uniref:Uncharacterized protein n=1 Tax=Ereboglobus luteus TaxID=1796921 RepID=A0A2U8E3D1_9BACT|nr:hypothetical protein CKA38_08590 [Ereboglobus luteus]
MPRTCLAVSLQTAATGVAGLFHAAKPRLRAELGHGQRGLHAHTLAFFIPSLGVRQTDATKGDVVAEQERLATE